MTDLSKQISEIVFIILVCSIILLAITSKAPKNKSLLYNLLIESRGFSPVNKKAAIIIIGLFTLSMIVVIILSA